MSIEVTKSGPMPGIIIIMSDYTTLCRMSILLFYLDWYWVPFTWFYRYKIVFKSMFFEPFR